MTFWLAEVDGSVVSVCEMHKKESVKHPGDQGLEWEEAAAGVRLHCCWCAHEVSMVSTAVGRYVGDGDGDLSPHLEELPEEKREMVVAAAKMGVRCIVEFMRQLTAKLGPEAVENVESGESGAFGAGAPLYGPRGEPS